MTWARIEGNWKDVKGQVREKWGRLTSDEVDMIAGKRVQLEGMLRRVYGKSPDQASREVDDFCTSCSCKE
jgi:uncharacterized protein YjbJ (UPF0337 family)